MVFLLPTDRGCLSVTGNSPRYFTRLSIHFPVSSIFSTRVETSTQDSEVSCVKEKKEQEEICQGLDKLEL